MAEICNDTPNSKHGKNKPTFKRRSTRVDLTPMVDLGFILVSFFVFTSTLFQAKAMNILMPNDTEVDVNDDVCASCAITLLPAANNQLYYYEGKPDNAILKQSTYNAEGLRNLLTIKRKTVIEKRGKDEMVLIVKPTAESSYKNLVDILDECNICMVKRYYIDEITPKEIMLVRQNSGSIAVQ